jgi:AraC family transcriptional regulator, regulatory protein of adaptative response / DNA-3-methyladenine glycosylase II
MVRRASWQVAPRFDDRAAMMPAMDRQTGATTIETVELPFTPPYAWEPVRDFLAARAIPGIEMVRGEVYRRSFAIDGRQGVVEVGPVAGGGSLAATVRFGVAAARDERPPSTVKEEVVRRIRRVFDLDADTAAIEAHLAGSQLLAPLVAARPGLRVPGAWDGFELGVRAILGQQITVVGARQLAAKLVARFGDPLEAAANSSELTHVFPDAARIAGADLSGFGVPGARARALVALGAAAAGDPSLFYRGAGLDASVERLRALPGIGEWSAQYIALRALGERDAFPAADVGLLRAATGSDGARPSPSDLLAQAEAWRPWRAYAAQHLWTSLADAP